MPSQDIILPTRRSQHRVALALTAALLYFSFAAATILLTSDGKSHATVWLADAAVLALLLSRPKSDWPFALALGWAANLAANALAREWAPGIILYGAINMAQVLLAAWTLRRCSDRGEILANARATFTFLFWAGLIAPAAGAIAGSTISLVNYGEAFLPSLERWYSSNALGIVILTSFLKSCFDGSYASAIRARPPRNRIEDLGLLLFHAAVSAFVFGQSGLPVLFAPLCSLLLLAFRSGRLATQAGVVIVGISGALAAIYHVGPVALVQGGPVFEAIFFQSYLAIMLGTALPVAALVASRAEALAEAARREELLRIILDHSPDAILSFDGIGGCQWADGATDELLGLSAAACRGASIDELALKISPVLANLSRAALAAPAEAHIADFNLANRKVRVLEATVKAVMSGERVVGIVATVRDVTAQRAREREIARLAMTDPLTQIPNRAGFDAAIERVPMKGEAACLALVDIDNFKGINDRFGHKVGDRALVELAATIVRLAGGKHLVARLGGDEFLILLTGDIAAAQCFFGSLQQEIAVLSASLGFEITISGGIAELNALAEMDSIFEEADRRLYRAKRGGRNQVTATAH